MTLDAMGCQKEIAEAIFDRGADYVLALKDNQGELRSDVEHLFKRRLRRDEAPDCEQVTSGHGRVETRRCWAAEVAGRGVLDEKGGPRLHEAFREKHGRRSNGEKYFKGYYLEAYDPNREPNQKWRSLGTKDKSAARHKFVKLERLVAMGEYDPWADVPDQDRLLFSEAEDLFLEGCERDGLAEKTIQNYRDVLRIFGESLPPGLMLRAVETSHVRDFLNDRDLAHESKKRICAASRGFSTGVSRKAT